MNHKERLLNGFLLYCIIALPFGAVMKPSAGVLLVVISYIAGAVADGLDKNPLNKLTSIVKND